MKWFQNIHTIEELRKEYRQLLKKYHPDNEGGSVEVTQEINAEYDALFACLSCENDTGDKEYDYDAVCALWRSQMRFSTAAMRSRTAARI